MTSTSNVILIAIYFLVISCSSNIKKIDKEVHSNDLKLNQEMGLVFHNSQPFSGISFSNYSNGIKSESIGYHEGKRHGLHKKWFENGDLSFESRYKNGLQSGTTKSWWKNGNLRSEANLVDGKGEGVQIQFYQSGKMFKKQNLVEGQEYGIQQSWRENGKIYNNYEVKNGRIFGLKRASLCFSLENENVVLNEKK